MSADPLAQDALVEACGRLRIICDVGFPEDGWSRVITDDLRVVLNALAAAKTRLAVSAAPYESQAAAWNDALEKAAQIVERYNAAFSDPECGGAPSDIRALKRDA